MENVKFSQSHTPITETFRFCLLVYLYMFQPSTGSSSGTGIFNFFDQVHQLERRIRSESSSRSLRNRKAEMSRRKSCPDSTPNFLFRNFQQISNQIVQRERKALNKLQTWNQFVPTSVQSQICTLVLET